MKINVTENKVSIKEEQILNENEYNIHKIQFDFSSEYTDDLVKVALFSIDNHTYKKIISNNECDIPPEVLTQRGYSILGVYAYKTEQDTLVLRYSPSPTKISVYDGSYKADAENSEPITPSEIEQYQQILQNSLQQFQNQYNALVEETEGDIQAIEDELQRKVDEGYFDGEDGFSPIAKVIQKSNGATIEIEDKNGKTTADVLNGKDGYTPVRGVDYWTEEDKQEVKEEATQQIEGKIEEYNENAAEKLNQYNQNSVQKTNDYNTNATEKFNDYNSNAEQKETNYNTNASQKVEFFNTNASSKLSEYNSNAETKKTAYDENATQKTNSFNTNATNKLTEYNTNHTEKMSTYNNNSTEKLNAFNENATQKTEDFDEHTEEIQDNIEKLQEENARLKATLPTTTGEGKEVTLNKTAELEFIKPPLPMGNSEQEGEPSPDNEVPITNVTGDVEVKVQNKNFLINPDIIIDSSGNATYENGVIKTGSLNAYNWVKYMINQNPITLLPGNYTLAWKMRCVSGTPSYCSQIQFNNDLSGYIQTTLTRTSTTINTTEYKQYYATVTLDTNLEVGNIFFQMAYGSSSAIYNIKDIMILKETYTESTVPDYIAHQEQTLPLTLGNIELCKIGDYQDYFYKESNKWYLHKEIAKKVLDGSENWGTSSTSTSGVYRPVCSVLNEIIKAPISSSNLPEVLCNYYKPITNDQSYTKVEGISISISGRIEIYDSNYNTNDISLYKTWLSTHNTEVYYALKTPTDTEITDTTLISQLEAINNALSYEEQTNISSNQNALFNVEAYQDIKEKIEEAGGHTHNNKAVLDGISSADITRWNNKSDFSGDYNDLSNKPTIPDVSGFITKDVNDLTNYTLKTNTGSLIDLEINNTTYVVTMKLKDVDGNVISTDTIDLPLETVVVSGRYDNTTKKVILTLENGSEVDFSVADLVAGLQTEITSSNKLASDLVDDTNSGNKFVTTSEKQTWNGKYDKPSTGIPKADLASAVQTSLGKADTAIQSHQDISGKANKISVVQTSASTIEINSNTFYKFGEVASLNITLASITDNTIYNEYMFEFVSGLTATTLTLPSSIKWLETPTIDANKIYQCSIVDNVGLLVGVANV